MRPFRIFAGMICAVAIIGFAALPCSVQTAERLSVASDGSQANALSCRAIRLLSLDAHLVAGESGSSRPAVYNDTAHADDHTGNRRASCYSSLGPRR
jgi:hypothetical protein